MTNLPIGAVVGAAAAAVALIILASLPAVLASRRAARETAGGTRTFDWLSGFVFLLGGAAALCAAAAYLVLWVATMPLTALEQVSAPEYLTMAAWFTSIGALAPSALAVVIGMFALPGRAANPRRYGRLLGLYGLMLAILSAAASLLIVAAG